jgi:Domain of unknown function DUF11
MRTLLAIGAVTVVAAAVLTVSASSQAAAPGIDLGMTGSVVTGVTRVEVGQEVPFSFTMENHSAARAADVLFAFAYNGTAGGVLCATTAHETVSPDGPNCEPGDLSPGDTVNAAVMVPAAASGTLTVMACASSERPDPVPGNNCTTLQVAVW